MDYELTLYQREEDYDITYQCLKDENGKVIFSVCNLSETPEDAIIRRDLFSAGDYLDAVRLGIKLANFGYTDVVIAKRVNLEDEDGIC